MQLVKFPELIPNWSKNPQKILNFRILNTLVVCDINSLSYLLTPSMALDLGQLSNLEIWSCDAMEQVILGEVSQAALFPELKRLVLQNLPKLTSFCDGNFIELSSLQELYVWSCSEMKTFIIDSSEKAEHTSTSALFDAKVLSYSFLFIFFVKFHCFEVFHLNIKSEFF